MDPHLLGNDARQGGLAQARGAMEQDVVQGLLPLPGRLDENGEIFLGFLLADILPQALRPQRTLLGVFLEKCLRHNGFLIDIASKVDAQTLTSFSREILPHEETRSEGQRHHAPKDAYGREPPPGLDLIPLRFFRFQVPAIQQAAVPGKAEHRKNAPQKSKGNQPG